MYTVKKIDDSALWGIYEVDNDALCIKLYPKESDARCTARSLNLGSGFNGFTPSFFAEEYMYKNAIVKQKEKPPTQ